MHVDLYTPGKICQCFASIKNTENALPSNMVGTINHVILNYELYSKMVGKITIPNSAH